MSGAAVLPISAVSPFSFLLEELLEDIFYNVRVQHDLETRHRPREDISWIAITHVSRHWRAVALASPRLWTALKFSDSSNILLKREFVLRSREMSLQADVFVGGDAQRLGQIFGTLRPHVARIGKMRMTALKERVISDPVLDFLSFLTTAGTALQDLTLDAQDVSFFISRLPPVKLPMLRSVKLVQVSLPWSSPIFAGLIALHLETGQNPPTLSQFLRIVEACPQLKELHLLTSTNILPAGTAEHPRPQCPLELPHLETLTLSSPQAADLACLLIHLHAPPTARLALTHTAARLPLSALLPASAAGAWPAHTLARCALVRLRTDRPRRLHTPAGWRTHALAIEAAASTAAHTLVALRWAWDAPVPRPITLATPWPSAFPAARRLVATRVHLAPSAWRALLLGMPHLTVLTLHFPRGGDNVAPLCAVLDALGGRGAVDGDDTSLCPALRELSVNASALGDMRAVDALDALCARRAELGVPLAVLDIQRRAHLAPGLRALLRDAVHVPFS